MADTNCKKYALDMLFYALSNPCNFVINYFGGLG